MAGGGRARGAGGIEVVRSDEDEEKWAHSSAPATVIVCRDNQESVVGGGAASREGRAHRSCACDGSFVKARPISSLVGE